MGLVLPDILAQSSPDDLWEGALSVLSVKMCPKERDSYSSEGKSQIPSLREFCEEQRFKFWMDGYGIYQREGYACVAGQEDGKDSGSTVE